MYTLLAAVDLERQITSMSINTALIAGAVLVLSTLVAMLAAKRLPKKRFKYLKLPLFLLMTGTILVTTGILAFNTVYLNVKSESKGPVHWHADIEFWACGSEIELRDPTGVLSNKIGTSTYHEHNDKRIHLEGVVVEKVRDASLGKFMEVTGGYINGQGVGIPVNKDSSTWLAHSEHQDGDKQSDGFMSTMSQYVGQDKKGSVLRLENGTSTCNNQPAELQVFAFRYNKDSKTYTQTKVANPASYVIRDESVVPAGDCVIVEFDRPKQKTDKLCNQYGIRDETRCKEFGVKEFNPDLCNIHEQENGEDS